MKHWMEYRKQEMLERLGYDRFVKGSGLFIGHLMKLNLHLAHRLWSREEK